MSKIVKVKEVNPRFESFIFDWDYPEYLLLGAYGSSKSYHIALKIILKLLHEKRKALVIREVFDTLKESCFDLFCEILEDMDLLEEDQKRKSRKVIAINSPMQLKFPNGSRIIFKGMDKPRKLKSINDVSIVWMEECSEIKYEGYKEIKLRLRTPELKTYLFLSTNPVDIDNWVYLHFFKRVDEQGVEHIRVDDEKLYKLKTLVNKGTYYHHSIPEDNKFLTDAYIKRLDELAEYDPDLYRIARLGRFGINGIRVLPQFVVAKSHTEVMNKVRQIDRKFKFAGFDFGFEESYNAVLRLAVDDKEKILYIYYEYYKNKMTDDKTAKELEAEGFTEEQIIADCEDPKAIQFYRQSGFKIRGCKKYKGSRLANTRKVKRFKKIVCSPYCVNTIRELKHLTYKKDEKGKTIYDEFNIDPHTFSAIWYALDNYQVADVKEIKRNTRRAS